MQNDMDLNLLAIFKQNDRELRDEPFLTNVTKHIERSRVRRIIARRMLLSLVIVVIAIASPWLIAGSVWLSVTLEHGFAEISQLLNTRFGMLLVVLLTAPVVFWNRKRIF